LPPFVWTIGDPIFSSLRNTGFLTSTLFII